VAGAESPLSESTTGPGRPHYGWVAGVLAASVALSRVLGYLREAVLSRVLGLGPEVDAYGAAFMLPDLLNYFLAGGALSIAFIPFYTRVLERRGEAAAQRFLSVVLGTTGLLAIVVTLAMWVGADALVAVQFPDFGAEQLALTARLTRILLPAQIFFIAGGVLRGALMARGHFASQSLAPVLYNGAIIAGGLLLGTRIGAEGFAWGALAGAVIGSFATAWLEARRVPGLGLGVRFALRDGDLRSYLVAALPLMLGVTLLTVDEWYDRWFGGLLAVGTIAALRYSRQLMLLPVAVVGQAIATAALPTLSRLHEEGREEAFHATLLGALRAGLSLACLGAAATFALAGPLVEFVYQGGEFTATDSARVVPLLRIFCFAVPAWIGQQIAVRGFYARGDTWRPMWLGTAVALAAAGLYYLLGRRYGAAGLATAGVLGMSVNCVATLVLLRWLHGGPSLRAVARTVARALGIAVVAGTVASFVPRPTPGAVGALLHLLAGGTAFAAVALAGLHQLGDDSQREALRAIARRVTRRRA